MTEPTMILWEIVEEHFDEAEFLFEQWDRASNSPGYSAAELDKRIERRLRAHIDGLVVGGAPVSDRLLQPGLTDKAGGFDRAAACVLTLLSMPDEETPRQVLGGIMAAEDSILRDGLARGFEVSDRAGLDEVIRDGVYSIDGPAQAVLLRALATRRADPGPIVRALLGAKEPELVCAALRAAVLRRPEEIGVQPIEALLDSSTPSVRIAAIELGVTWGLRAAWQQCVTLASAGDPDAMRMVGQFGGPRDATVLFEALSAPDRRVAALVALGYTGRREAIEACLPLIGDEDKPTAQLAGEAFCAITGLEPTKAFCRPEKEDTEWDVETEKALPPLAQDIATDLSMSSEDELAFLQPEICAAWWRGRENAFEPGRRYIRGQLASPESVTRALLDGPMRRARWLALELQVRSQCGILIPSPRFGWASVASAALGDAVSRLDLQGHIRWA